MVEKTKKGLVCKEIYGAMIENWFSDLSSIMKDGKDIDPSESESDFFIKTEEIRGLSIPFIVDPREMDLFGFTCFRIKRTIHHDVFYDMDFLSEKYKIDMFYAIRGQVGELFFVTWKGKTFYEGPCPISVGDIIKNWLHAFLKGKTLNGKLRRKFYKEMDKECFHFYNEIIARKELIL